MPKNTALKYHLVEIEFYDHAEIKGDRNPEPCLCKLFGCLFKEDDVCYYVATWVTGGDPLGEDSHLFAVLKSAVIEIKKISKVKAL